MRRLFRWLFRLLITAVVLAVALVLLKDILFKAVAERRLREQTGLSVTIRKLEVGLLSPTIAAEGIKFYNPPEFGGSVLLDLPEIYLEYDPAKAALGSIHLNLLRLKLSEISLVKNNSGRTNLFSLFSVPASKAAPAAPAPDRAAPSPPRLPPAASAKPVASAPPPAPAARGRRLEFDGIDRLYLSLDNVTFVDQAAPSSNWVRAVGWKDRELKNIRTADDAQKWAILLFLQVAVPPPRPLPPTPVHK
jgi:hypothetical protein